MAAIAKDCVLSRLPIIVILGATGTGKSKLALQVAKQFNGEIISADAMQVYRGLDIVTNKVSPEELRQVPHHMLDYLSPGQPTQVVDFRDRALPIVADLQERRKLPVVAGGTCYYVEALLWKLLMPAPGAEEPPAKRAKVACGDGSAGGGAVQCGVRGVSCVDGRAGEILQGLRTAKEDTWDAVNVLSAQDKADLHEALRRVDPERGQELHPNNVRKVIRSLQVFQTTGRRHSELILEQKAQGGNHLGGPLRFQDSVILWVTCDQPTLDARLDTRVDEMVRQGLIAELQAFHQQYNRQRVAGEDGELRSAAYTVGVFQSIGFKEFHDYLVLSEEQRDTEEGRKLFAKGLELMKVATRQYARRQIKWIRQRFLGRGVLQVPPLYALNGTDVDQWDSQVRDSAFSVVRSALEGSPCPVAPEPVLQKSTVDHKMMWCEQCERLFEGANQFDIHMRSQKHRRRLAKLAREAAALSNTSQAVDTSTSITATTISNAKSDDVT